MPGKGGSESRLGLKAWLKKGGVAMDWSYFVLAELLFFVLFLLFLIWQYLSLKRDKALLKAQRAAEAIAAEAIAAEAIAQAEQGHQAPETASAQSSLSQPSKEDKA
ncbi:MAG: hypothetical protein EBT36_11265 [Betaproteobacteria bacterium]|nr:hypothetical protein [Betaproteobacteria bacterium]NBQ94825.1 hypothetical protein [Betaproteobacteria bacterium]NBT71949.1 hypothetical protein [Betaproteobacteria bacterium]NBT81303.1 hypothetical protein [Betaproteobacteria bacterium]NCV15048.1 hypothetical protein [Betaproteobacteria bacterium]